MHDWLLHDHLRELVVLAICVFGVVVTYAVGRGIAIALSRVERGRSPSAAASRPSQERAQASVRPLVVSPRDDRAQATGPRPLEWADPGDLETDPIALDPPERKSA